MTPDALGVPAPPEEPHPDECCHRGCCPCIMDYYDDAMDRWRARVREKGLDPDQVLAALGRGPRR